MLDPLLQPADQIQVYFDTVTERFASLTDKLWPNSLEFKLWNWGYYPEIA
ncbi:hypothetical protein [Desulfotruncus arcticus]|nr:hypothetical protein [Desulfotruncus arcticus]